MKRVSEMRGESSLGMASVTSRLDKSIMMKDKDNMRESLLSKTYDKTKRASLFKGGLAAMVEAAK
jgi:hypothetical protein